MAVGQSHEVASEEDEDEPAASSELISDYLSRFTLGNVGQKHNVCFAQNYTHSHWLNVTCDDRSKM